MALRTLGQLLDVDEAAWPFLCDCFAHSRNMVEVLSASALARGEALLETQVSVRSTLGAIVYETGGLLIDHGWLRILGSGHPRLPRTLPDWNRGRTSGPDGNTGFYLVADDVVGGFFALNGGGLGNGKNEIFYLSPDSLTWEPMRLSYTAFLHWALMGDLHSYYMSFRWLDWEADALAVNGDRAISFYPILSAPGPRLERRRRGTVPVAELYDLHLNSAPAQLQSAAIA